MAGFPGNYTIRFVRRGHGNRYRRVRRLSRRIHDLGLNHGRLLTQPRFDEHIRRVHPRGGDQSHRLPDPAHVRPAPVRRRVSHQVVHAVLHHRRAHHPHGQPIRLAEIQHSGHVELERAVPALVTSQDLSVDPYFGPVVDGVETQPDVPLLPRLGHGKLPRVPGHAFVILPGLLPTTRHANFFTAHGRRERLGLVPLGFPARVLGVKQNLPSPVQRDDLPGYRLLGGKSFQIAGARQYQGDHGEKGQSTYH